MIFISKITVVDALMGAGKSTWAFDYINKNADKSFVYVTPLLDEIRRIQKACPEIKLYDPKQIDGRKINGFNWLLERGLNVAVSHATFSNSDEDTLQFLKNGKYTLILDEVLDILVGFNDVATKKIRSGDPALMLDRGLIKVDKYGKVAWTAKDYEGSSFEDVKSLADKGNLYYLDDSLLVWQFPPSVFETFEECYILTYLFDGSFLKPYFQYHGLQYELKTFESGAIIPYHPPTKKQFEEIRDLITLDDNYERNNYKGFSLSKSYYEKASKKDKSILQKHIQNYIRNVAKARAREIMWTAFEDNKPKKIAIRSALEGAGYTRRPITIAEENEIRNDTEMTHTEKERKIINLKSCYVSNNMRASNDYRDRNTLVYALNLFPNRYVTRYFSNKNESDNMDIHVDDDMFSLSCLVQWVWRSCIRDHKPIQIYIPSKRMRDLFIRWMSGEFGCEATS